MPTVWESDFEDAEHLVSGFPRFRSASLGENRTLTMEKVYQITPAEFVPLVLRLPKKGRVHLIEVDGVWCWFQIDSVSVERLGTAIPSSITGAGTLRAGTFLVRAELVMSLLKRGAEPDTPPWELPAYRFRASPVPLETGIREFYPTAGDALLGAAGVFSAVPFPFVNTAGVPLDAKTTRPLTRFQFYYNLEATAAGAAGAAEFLWFWPGHCNASAVRFAGIVFPPLTLLFESFSYEECEEDYSYRRFAGGAETAVSGTWRYLKCRVSLLADPETFARSYANAGAHIAGKSGIERLWNWTAENGALAFGPYAAAKPHGDAQEVTETLFLNDTGTGLSPFGSDGRQVPTVRRGVVLEPLDFNLLGLPEDLPIG